MIGSLRGVSAYAYGEPCDMRKSFATLSAIIANQLRRDLMSGDLFIFVGKDHWVLCWLQNHLGVTSLVRAAW